MLTRVSWLYQCHQSIFRRIARGQGPSGVQERVSERLGFPKAEKEMLERVGPLTHLALANYQPTLAHSLHARPSLSNLPAPALHSTCCSLGIVTSAGRTKCQPRLLYTVQQVCRPLADPLITINKHRDDTTAG